MKKILVSLISIVLAVGSLAAQTKNKISVSISDNIPLLIGSALGGGVIGSLTDGPAGTELGECNTRGCYTLGYVHSLSSKFNLGAELTYAGANLKFEDKKTHKVVSTSSADIYMLMATGQYQYITNGIVSLGGDVSLGVMSDFDGSTSMAFQIDPIDFRVGKDTFGGFMRLGLGVRGFITLGVDFSF